MSNEKELRELDARFAAEVMGWTDCDPAYVSGRWEFTDPPEPPVVVGAGTDPEYGRRPLLKYTRSLDAAWAGVEKLGLNWYMTWSSKYFCVSNYDEEGYNCAWGGTSCGRGAPELAVGSAHPAEAIVRACLAAVEAQRNSHS